MIKFLYIAVGVYSLMGAYLYLMQRNMMYFPTPENNHRQAEVVWLETNQQRLKIWRINNAAPALFLSAALETDHGLIEDALAVYDAISQQHSSVSLIGRSLGSAIAIHVAAHREVERLALITPFDSLKNVAQSHYPLFPVKWLMKDPYDSIELADRIDQPVLALTAEHDRIIPSQHSEKLLQALTRARVESHVITGSGHNDLSFNPSFDRLLGAFFKR